MTKSDPILGLKLIEKREGYNTVYTYVYTGQAIEEGKTKVVVRTYSHNHDVIKGVPEGTGNFITQKSLTVDDFNVEAGIERIIREESAYVSFIAGNAHQHAYETVAFAHIKNGKGYNVLPHSEWHFPHPTVQEKRNNAESSPVPKIKSPSIPYSNLSMTGDVKFLSDTDGD